MKTIERNLESIETASKVRSLHLQELGEYLVKKIELIDPFPVPEGQNKSIVQKYYEGLLETQGIECAVRSLTHILDRYEEVKRDWEKFMGTSP